MTSSETSAVERPLDSLEEHFWLLEKTCTQRTSLSCSAQGERSRRALEGRVPGSSA